MTMPGVNANIMVAISFDKRLEGLLKTTCDLFAQTEVTITLVHVIKESLDSIVVSSLVKEGSYKAHVLQSEARKIAEDRLRRLASAVDRRLQLKTAVLHGNVVDALATYAKKQQMDMIILGTTQSKGLSTAFQLIASKTIPVLIIHEDAHLVDYKKEHRIVIGDDLLAGGAAAVTWGFKLSELLGEARILHVHVLNMQEVAKHLDETYGKPIRSLDQALDAMRKFMKTTKKNLSKRFSEATGLPESRFEDFYENEAAIGNIAGELEKSALTFRADIAIFSLHKLYQPEFLDSGRVSFRSMLESDRLVMVVPEAQT